MFYLSFCRLHLTMFLVRRVIVSNNNQHIRLVYTYIKIDGKFLHSCSSFLFSIFSSYKCMATLWIPLLITYTRLTILQHHREYTIFSPFIVHCALYTQFNVDFYFILVTIYANHLPFTLWCNISLPVWLNSVYFIANYYKLHMNHINEINFYAFNRNTRLQITSLLLGTGLQSGISFKCACCALI